MGLSPLPFSALIIYYFMRKKPKLKKAFKINTVSYYCYYGGLKHSYVISRPDGLPYLYMPRCNALWATVVSDYIGIVDCFPRMKKSGSIL